MVYSVLFGTPEVVTQIESQNLNPVKEEADVPKTTNASNTKLKPKGSRTRRFSAGRQASEIYCCALLSSLNYSVPATLKVSTASSPERAKIINSQEHVS
jgi:hypothetical protein